MHRDGQAGDDGLEVLIGRGLAQIGEIAGQDAEIGVAIALDHRIDRLLQAGAGIERHRQLALGHHMQVAHHHEFQVIVHLASWSSPS